MARTALTPSRIARAYAASAWPDVQSQTKLAPGVFDFSCAGHGGTVAVLDFADLPAELVALARKHSKTEYVGLHGRSLITSEQYTRETFERMREHGMPVFEVWAGEEDCDWSLIALASERICAAMAEKMRDGSPMATADGMHTYALENAARWNPGYLRDVAERYAVDLNDVRLDIAEVS